MSTYEGRKRQRLDNTDIRSTHTELQLRLETDLKFDHVETMHLLDIACEGPIHDKSALQSVYMEVLALIALYDGD